MVWFTSCSIASSTSWRASQNCDGVNRCATLVIACCANRRKEGSHIIANFSYTRVTSRRANLYWKATESSIGWPPLSASWSSRPVRAEIGPWLAQS